MEHKDRVEKFLSRYGLQSVVSDDEVLKIFIQLCLDVFNAVPNCNSCNSEIDAYFIKLRAYLKPQYINNMSKRFRIIGNAVVYSRLLGMHFTNDNLEDDAVWLILQDAPGNSVLFEGLPTDWKDQIPTEIERIKKAAAASAPAKSDAELADEKAAEEKAAAEAEAEKQAIADKIAAEAKATADEKAAAKKIADEKAAEEKAKAAAAEAKNAAPPAKGHK